MLEIHKQIIETVRKGLQKHEDSYEPKMTDEQIDAHIKKHGHAPWGEYKRSQEDCFIEAAKEAGLPEHLWYIIYLANHWTNDLQGWCDEVENGTFNLECSNDSLNKIEKI